MLDSAKTLQGYTLKSQDADIGHASAFYFDDQFWAVRYVVAETGNWLTGRQVLISPYAIEAVRASDREILVALSKAEIEASPPLDNELPVSRQYENEYYGHYGWPTYWTGPSMWGTSPVITRDRAMWPNGTMANEAWDPHLRSTAAVHGYDLQATDGEIGSVADFIVDDETWAIRYLVIETGSWWAGKQVLVSPKWIDRVSWEDSKVFLTIPRDKLRHAPEFVEGTPISREYEQSLHRHYDVPGYWAQEHAIAGQGAE